MTEPDLEAEYPAIAERVAQIIWQTPESHVAVRAYMVMRAAANQLTLFGGHEFRGPELAQDTLRSLLAD